MPSRCKSRSKSACKKSCHWTKSSRSPSGKLKRKAFCAASPKRFSGGESIEADLQGGEPRLEIAQMKEWLQAISQSQHEHNLDLENLDLEIRNLSNTSCAVFVPSLTRSLNFATKSQGKTYMMVTKMINVLKKLE